MVPRLRLLRPQADEPAAADPAGDAELVHRLRGGDPRAAVLVWRNHSVMVRGLVVRTIGPGAEVEDLVQDIFAVLFRKVNALQDPTALRSFLFGIALREIRGELRKRRVRRWLELSKTGELGDYFASGD